MAPGTDNFAAPSLRLHGDMKILSNLDKVLPDIPLTHPPRAGLCAMQKNLTWRGVHGTSPPLK